MAFPVDGVIQFTLNKMNERIRQHAEGAPVNEQSGLIFMGNVHDAVPRRLFLIAVFPHWIRWHGS